MKKMAMERNTNATVREVYNRFMRIKKARNLSPDTLRHYEIYFRYFSVCADGASVSSTTTKPSNPTASKYR